MDEIKTGSPTTAGRKIQEWNKALNKYKAGKTALENRVIAAEEWWRLRNEAQAAQKGVNLGAGFKAKSAWLHNVIVSKHADAMESYPEPLLLPREQNDKDEAKRLSSILPEIFDANDFEETYAQAWWDKLKTGTAVYKVTWNAEKLNGLGDVEITAVDLLDIFFEPGVSDIQKSKYIFHTAWVDDDKLEEDYPELKGKLKKAKTFVPSEHRTDDPVSRTDQSLLIDVYYKKRGVLHYAKYCEDVILYSTENFVNDEEYKKLEGEEESTGTENEPSLTAQFMDAEAETNTDEGLYSDGKFPFIFDPLFPMKNSPCGYGYVDVCQNSQIQIDLMDQASLQNFMFGAKPKYFKREGAGVNEDDLLDTNKSIVEVTGGMLDENCLRVVDYKPLSGNYISAYQNKVTELRETSGNTETATGSSTSGVTSGAGVAALQEASGKTSRDASKASYRKFKELTKMVIERIRQFYDMPRQFRIAGENGEDQFVTYSNEGLQAQPLGNVMGVDMGYRLPEFDIKIEVQKKNAYTRQAQNDLALQFYQMHFFDPANSQQALACLDMMDFDGKESMIRRLNQNGTMMQVLQTLAQYALGMASKYSPQDAPMLQQSLMTLTGGQPAPAVGSAKMPEKSVKDENPIVERARARANAAGTTEA